MTMINTPLNFGGSRTTIRISHADQPDGIAVTDHEMPHGYATPLHVHVHHDEVFHILRGSLCAEVAGQLVRAGAGDCLKAPKGVPHRFIVDAIDGARVLVFTVGRDFESFVREVSTPLASDETAVSAPTEEDIARQMQAAGPNGIEMMGPPLTLDQITRRAA